MPKPFKVRLRRKTRRIFKTSVQWLKGLSRAKKQPARAVFVFGSQRSGTRLPIDVLDLSPHVTTYKEGNSQAFNRVLLKSNAEIRELLRTSLFPIVAFKPISDSHRAAELLEYFPQSKAIWIFRNYRDAVNSAVRKWQHGMNNLKHIASGNLAAAGWRAGGLTLEKIELVRRFYSEEMSSHTAYALMWYLRNHLFLDLHIHHRQQVCLVKYEDLVKEPCVHFSRFFRFIDCPFEEKFVRGVYNSSVGKDRFPEIPEELDRLCENLYFRLQSIYQDSLAEQRSPVGT
ncbi:MAG: sulfotransferase domain-containing protein [bacterium]